MMAPFPTTGAGQAYGNAYGPQATGHIFAAATAVNAAEPPRLTLSRQQLVVLILSLMAMGIGQSLVFAILAPLGREVALTELQITSIIASSSFAFALSSPVWGRVSDRVGRKPIIITGLVGYTVGTLVFTSIFYAGLTGVISGLALYLLALFSRAAQAMVMSATNPSSTAYAADHTSPAERTRTMARLGTANSMGMILGPAIGGAMATLGLLAPLYLAGGMSAFAALLIWRFLPRTPPSALRSRVKPPRLRFLDPRLRIYVLTSVAMFIGFSSIQQTIGFLIQDTLGLDGIATAQMTGAALMVSAVFSFLVQITVMQRAKFTPGTFVRLGLFCMLAGASIIGNTANFATLAAGMGFIGAGLGLTMPAIMAGSSLAVDAGEQGGAAGLIGACPAIGFIVGPLCGGALYQIDPILAPLFSAVVFFLALVLLVLRERRRSG